MKAILVINGMATVIKISRVYFHHVAAQVTKRQIENTAYVSHVLWFTKVFSYYYFFSSQNLEDGHF